MKLKTVLFALALAPTMAIAADNIPSGWIKAGSHPAEYEVGIDSSTYHGGRASGYVKAITKDLHGFGTLMQTTGPGQYLGKRVRLSAFVRAEMVGDWAGLWLRVDGPLEGNQPKPLAFDNMQGPSNQGHHRLDARRNRARRAQRRQGHRIRHSVESRWPSVARRPEVRSRADKRSGY